MNHYNHNIEPRRGTGDERGRTQRPRGPTGRRSGEAETTRDLSSELDIIDRTEVSQQPLRVEYTLTERGDELEGVIQSLADWGESHLDSHDEERVVLIADDDTRVITMHETWLEDAYAVRTARDGKER